MFFLPTFLYVLVSLSLLLQENTPSTLQRQEDTQSPSTTSAPLPETAAKPSAVRPQSVQMQNLKEQAWEVLQNGVAADKKQDRAAAVHATGLIPGNPRARKIAESALEDGAPEVRAAAAAALGDMKSQASVPKLLTATNDKDPGVALAAAHSLIELGDSSGYSVYYEVLTGERKTGKGLAAEAAAYKDPKKIAVVGFHQALGFVPFGGVGWQAFKMVKKDDSSPARAAAATALANDRDPKTKEALVNAMGDKNWIIREAALEALAKRGDPSVLGTVQLYLTDDEGAVKYAAAAAALHLAGIKEHKSKSGMKNK